MLLILLEMNNSLVELFRREISENDLVSALRCQTTQNKTKWNRSSVPDCCSWFRRFWCFVIFLCIESCVTEPDPTSVSTYRVPERICILFIRSPKCLVRPSWCIGCAERISPRYGSPYVVLFLKTCFNIGLLTWKWVY